MTDGRVIGWTGVTVTAARPPATAPLPAWTPTTYDHELAVTHRDGGAVFLSPPDPSPAAALDVLVETVCDLLDVDYAGVHVVEGDVHRVVAESDTLQPGVLPRNDTLCGVLLTRHPVVTGGVAPLQLVEVRDTATDPTLPLVVHDPRDEAPVRFYAATPLTDPQGRALGTLCVIACHPRSLTAVERRTLLLLGVAASALLARCRDAQDG